MIEILVENAVPYYAQACHLLKGKNMDILNKIGDKVWLSVRGEV